MAPASGSDPASSTRTVITTAACSSIWILKAAVSQGITTIVVGQDGGSHDPLAEIFCPPSPPHLPQSMLRPTSDTARCACRILGTDFKRAAPVRTKSRRWLDLLRGDMKAGALGLSAGFEDDPGIYSDPVRADRAGERQVVTLPVDATSVTSATRTAPLGRRSRKPSTIGREAGIPGADFSPQAGDASLWGQTDRLIKMLDDARASGVQVTADIYPYTYWQAGMTVLFRPATSRIVKPPKFALREVTSRKVCSSRATRPMAVTRARPSPPSPRCAARIRRK